MIFRPTLIVEDITQINLDQLTARGVKGFIFDLDNTLIAPGTGVLEARIEAWLAEMKQKGFQSVVVSNNPLNHYIERVRPVLSMPIIGNAKKPRRRYLKEAVTMMALTPPEVAIVGDRPLTDIWGGVRLNMTTILVDPLTKATEPRLVQYLRKLERMLVKV